MKLRLVITIVILVVGVFIGVQIITLASSRTAATESPTVVAAVAPPYPIIARIAHMDGEVTVETSISSDGEVVSAKALRQHPLASIAEQAAKQWRFAATTAVSAHRTASLIFVFQIMPRCASVIDLMPRFYPPYKVEVRVENPPIICDDCSAAVQERLKCKNP